MDIGPVTRIEPRSDSSGMPRASVGQPATAATELPASQSVTSAADAAKTGDHRGQENAGSRERHVSIDAATRSVVSQVVDRQSGDILSQVPDQALLRLKAYAREVVAELDSRKAKRVERIA